MHNLPLFPLSSIVMPGGQLRLRIFEPRYLSMVRSCLKTESGFGICLISERKTVDAPAEAYPYGTFVEIVDWDRDDNGLFMIVTKGVQRFRTVASSIAEDHLLVGEVELLPLEASGSIPEKYLGMADYLKRAFEISEPFLDYDHNDSDFSDSVWVSNRLVELLPMPNSQRHELIAIGDSVERLALLQELIIDKLSPR